MATIFASGPRDVPQLFSTVKRVPLLSVCLVCAAVTANPCLDYTSSFYRCVPRPGPGGGAMWVYIVDEKTT